MNNITVTVELCAEDRARLDKLIEATENAAAARKTANEMSAQYFAGMEAPAQKAAEAPQTEAVEEPKKNPTEAEKPAETEPAKPEEAPAPTVTSADVRALVQKLVAPGTGKRDATKEIVTQYAANVGSIPEDKLSEVFEKLKALEVSK